MRMFKFYFADREMKKRTGMKEHYYTIQCFSKLPEDKSYALFLQQSFNKEQPNAYDDALEFMMEQMKTYKN